MVALIGFAMIVAIVFLLLKGKMSPIVVLTLIPAIAALLLGFGPVEIADFIKDGARPPQATAFCSFSRSSILAS